MCCYVDAFETWIRKQFDEWIDLAPVQGNPMASPTEKAAPSPFAPITPETLARVNEKRAEQARIEATLAHLCEHWDTLRRLRDDHQRRLDQLAGEVHELLHPGVPRYL